jgi:membrane-associated phospholipid phosphatase
LIGLPRPDSNDTKAAQRLDMLNWIAVTRLADTVVMLPAAALCLTWLLMSGATRLALWWCVLLTGGLALVAVTKIAFLGWGIGIPAWDFTGISGHAMRANAIMPVLLYLVFIKSSRRVRQGAVMTGAAFGVLLGVSRFVVNAHSPSEVVTGCLLGAIVSTAFLAMMPAPPRPGLEIRPAQALPLLLLLLLPIFTAKPAPTERWLRSVAMTLSGHEKLYSRGYEKRQEGV